MKRFSVITLFPEMIQQIFSYGVVGQAVKHNVFELETINPREFSEDVHRTVDDRPYGGGDGMVMLCGPLEACLKKVIKKQSLVIYLSPQGVLFDNAKARELAGKEHLVLISGRYGGIDQRVINHYVNEEISIGNYILSGGELAAGVVIDSVARYYPGVLGHQESVCSDSFSEGYGGYLEAPMFTRPREFRGQVVPEILLSGNHDLIAAWREKVGQLVTLAKRPELMLDILSSPEKIENLFKFWKKLSDSEKDLLGIRGLTESDFFVVDKYEL